MSSTALGLHVQLQQLVAAARQAKDGLPEDCHLNSALTEVIDRGSREVEVVVFGSGNVGKTSLTNSLLGKDVFWPVSRARMTGRLCKTHYGDRDEYSLGDDGRLPIADGKISKEQVNNSTVMRNQRDEFCAQLRIPLHAWTQSSFLNPGVVLVDAPGLDQETDHSQALREHMQSTCADQVVLLYVMDVNDGMRNSDRQFLEELKRSQWTGASLRMLLVLNKCDTLTEEDDEEVLNYEELVAELVNEAKNYCQPTVCRLSIRDWKRGGKKATQEWNEMFAAVQSSIIQQKQLQLQRCLHDAHRVLTGLETVLDAGQKLQEKKTELDEKSAQLSKATAGKDEFILERAEEIKKALESNQDAHLQALQKREVVHQNKRITKLQAKEVDTEITNIIVSMIQNDIQVSVDGSGAYAQLLTKTSLPIFGLSKSVRATVLLVAAMAFGVLGGLALYVFHIVSNTVVVNAEYKEQVFISFYMFCIDKVKEFAAQEYTRVVEVLDEAINSDREIIADLQQKKGSLDVSICEKIFKDLGEAVEKSDGAPEDDEDSAWEVIPG